MEMKGLIGLCVLLCGAVSVNSQWLSSRWSAPCCDLSPWRGFPLLSVRASQDWPPVTRPDWPVMSLFDDGWWDELTVRKNLDLSHCPKGYNRLYHYPTQQQLSDHERQRGCSSSVQNHCSNQPVPQQSVQTEQNKRQYKAHEAQYMHHATLKSNDCPPEAEHQAPLKPNRGPIEHQTQFKHQNGPTERQAPLEHQRGPTEHKANFDDNRAKPETQTPLKRSRVPPESGIPLNPKKSFSEHQASSDHHRGPKEEHAQSEVQQSQTERKQSAETKPSQYSKSARQLEEVLSIPLLGFSPRELKITHHGNHIRVSASRTCSSSDGCVSREMEKTYDLPYPIAKGSMKASMDPNLKFVIIKGVPTEPLEDTAIQVDDHTDSRVTGYTEETEEILAEDV